jgi:flagellar hook protein FlgE
MIESIRIASTGLRGFESGLRTISNNTANLNTPGFKGSTTQFADLFSDPASMSTGGTQGQTGRGLNMVGTRLNFGQGALQPTGNALDLAIDGQGFFTLRDDKGRISYTQDGQFKFDDTGELVSVTTGHKVVALGPGGELVPMSVAGLEVNPPKPTTNVVFSGNVSSAASAPTATVNNITVIDAAGGSHTLKMTLAPVSGSPGNWTVTLLDGTTTVGTSRLVFNNARPTTETKLLSFTYQPNGVAPTTLTLDFSGNVTSNDTGSITTLAMTNQNGYVLGTLTSRTFDNAGTLVLGYSNGQTVKGAQLALGLFRNADDVVSIGNNQYVAKNGASWSSGVAGSGQFGKIQSGVIEGSNIELSQEFSDLVIMQRGYQACSQVVSTASEMLTALFGMVGK